MKYVLQAICTNGCASVLLITLLLNYGRKHNNRNKESTLFVVMLISNLFQCIVETITVIIDGEMFAGAIPLATALNAFLFMNNIVFAYLWFLYADVKINYGNRRKHAWEKLTFIPALLIVICSVINLFTPVFFKITDQNLYERVGIYLLAYVVTYGYLIAGTANIYIHRKRREKFTFLPVFTFLLPVCLASVIQYCVQGVSLMWAGAAVGLSSAYMSLLEEGALTDKLSGLFLRHYLNQFLTTLPNKAKEANYLLGIMLDVDDFKAINDNFGHLVGDDAIAGTGHILRKALPENRFVFRYAGDEFVVITPIDDLSEIDPIIAKIHSEAERYGKKHEKPYDLHFSIGYTTYIAGENPNTFLDRMDSEMYKVKKNANR